MAYDLEDDYRITEFIRSVFLESNPGKGLCKSPWKNYQEEIELVKNLVTEKRNSTKL